LIYEYDEDGHPIAWASQRGEEYIYGKELWIGQKHSGRYEERLVRGKIWHDFRECQKRTHRTIIQSDTQAKTQSNIINTIKERLSLLEVAEHYKLEVRIAGRAHMVSCPHPEHADNNPSCALWNDIGIFKCFSCGAKGDVIELIRLLEANND